VRKRFGNHLSRLALFGVALAASSLPSTRALAAPVTWEFNGHSYEFVRLLDPTTSWEQAQAQAEDMSIANGDVGYLATIGSAEEQEFIQSQVLPTFGLHKNQVWIGGRQDEEGATAAPAANWRWIVNPEVAPENWSYTNWLAENEPSNDGDIDERFLTMWVHFYENQQDLGRGKWNDEKLVSPSNAVIIGMIVEYSLPEPGTALLVALGAALLALRTRRA
jgi:hypothetical protein